MNRLAAPPSCLSPLWVAGFALLYLGGAELGHLLAVPAEPSHVFPLVWPPAGIYFAVLALTATRQWPALVGAAAAANLTSDLLLHDQAAGAALGFAAANAIQAVAAAALLRWSCRVPCDLSRLPGVYALMQAAALAPAAGALLGAAVAMLAGGTVGFPGAWLQWWASCALGMVLLAPPLLFFNVPGSGGRWWLVQSVAMFAALTAAALAAFSHNAFLGLAPLFLTLPPLGWAAIRLGTRCTAFANLVLALLALALTARGLGPFADPAASPQQRALALQTYLAVVAVGSLAMAAAFRERRQAESALRESEQRYRMLVEHSIQGILVHQDDVITFANPALARMFGYDDPAELIGRNREVLLAPEAVPELRQRTALLRGGAAEDTVAPLHPGWAGCTRDGRTIWVQSLASRATWNGRPAIHAVFLDVTERHRAEEARLALESERADLLGRLQMILDRMPIGCVLNDAEFRFTYWNPAAERIFGYRFDEVRGRHPFGLITPPASQPYVGGIFQQLAAGAPAADGVGANLTRDGRTIYCEWHNTALRNADGTFAGVLSMCQDVSDRRRAEEELRHSREMLRAVLDNIPLSVFWKDTDCRYLGCNRAAARVAGVETAEGIVGKTDHDLPSTPEEAEGFRRWDRRVMDTDTPAAHVLEQLHLPGGSVAWLDTTKVPLHDADGRVIGLVGMFEDITERKKAESRLLGSLREKESLLKEVHHRVKNNLQIICSLLSLQESRIENPAALDVFRQSQDRVRSMALIHESLYRSGDLARVDMAPHVQGLCAQLLRSHGDGAGRVKLTADVGEAHLELDQAVPVGLIINELVTNALKYAFPEGQAGGVRVSLHSGPDRLYTIQVADDGVGMPPDMEDGRAGSLGLTLVRDLAAQMDGSLSVRCDGGTVFTITFPG